MVSRQNSSRFLVVLLVFIFGIGYYYINSTTLPRITYIVTREIIRSLPVNQSPALNIIDLKKEGDANFTCIKTKYLLHLVQTTICLHDARDAVSNEIKKKKIWEEKYLTELLGFLIRYPQMSFIDAGANLGAYTLFIASFGRRVLSIECFKPNIERIRRAVQIENLQDKVILIGNAIYSESGHYFKMKSDPTNVGSQAVVTDNDINNTIVDPFAVQTIRFDDMLPIFIEENIRNAVMKVDIQWSEVYLCQTGDKIFDYVNIPVVLMEWDIGARHDERIRAVVKYFIGRGYVPTADMCVVLQEADALKSWPSDIYWMKMNISEIC